jgi:hypothetical protein
MGILDDAIRQHLELKRQHGADRADVERLEQEAFGPVARPGDPEFDTGTEAAAPAATEQPPAEAPSAEQPAAPAAEEAAPAPAEEPPGGFTDWFAGEEKTTVPPAAEAPPEAPPATPAEQARIEHADLGETADHPAPTQLGPEDEAEPVPDEESPSSEEQPAAEQPIAEAPAEPAAEEAPPEAPESGIFDGGETDFEEDLGAAPEGEAAVTPAPTTDHDLPPAPVQRPGEEGEDAEGEDLLEETPDFLQDAPEGEDLWFEQGPPKDFDFDDEDED